MLIQIVGRAAHGSEDVIGTAMSNTKAISYAESFLLGCNIRCQVWNGTSLASQPPGDHERQQR